MKSKTEKSKLPSKPSDLIEVALKDLIKCEKSPKYKIDMDDWHSIDYGSDICEVCLGGSVMAQTLETPIGYASPDFVNEYSNSIKALDDFRRGSVGVGFWNLNLDGEEGEVFNREITDYEENAGKFKRQMRKLARDLRAAGF